MIWINERSGCGIEEIYLMYTLTYGLFDKSMWALSYWWKYKCLIELNKLIPSYSFMRKKFSYLIKAEEARNKEQK